MSFFIFLGLGMVAMILCMLYAGKIYGIERRDVIITAVYLTICGTFATYIMFFIETGQFGGRSFFGAAFFVPVFMYPLAKILKIRYGYIMDICAPAGCIMLFILKFKCYLDGCCEGKLIILKTTAFRFPSQIVESVLALVLAAVIMLIIIKGRHKTMVYPILLVIYGIMRFFLNLLREVDPWLGPLPAGNVWSLLAIIIGIIVLVVNKRKVQPKPVN